MLALVLPKFLRHVQRFVWIAIAALMMGIILPYPAVEATVTPKHYTDLTLPPLPAVQIPKYSRFRMGNGITVYLVEDHELPVVSGLALFPGGSQLEPAKQTGLATLTGLVMRSGGTNRQSAQVLNQFLENRAASVESFMGTTASGANFFSLKADLDDVLTTFSEVLRQPAFAPDQFDLIKSRFAGGISRRNDDPDDIVSREFQKLVYGADSPFARTVEYKTLDAIRRDDLIAFHRRIFQPQTMILGVIGDFNSREMKSMLKAKFENWQASEPPLTRPSMDVKQQNQGIFLVNQPQLTQSYVQIGHLGGLLNNPDYPALSVMNQVLNGFGGRLFNEVRSRQGLAYSVYAAWGPQYDYPGVFTAGGETRSEATVPFIQALRQEIKTLQTTPIREAELQLAKDKVLNSFVFNFQDPGQTLSRLLRYALYGYPQDFIFKYQQGVQRTTTHDVLRVAQTYLQPQRSVTLVVGNQAAIQPSLSAIAAPNEQVQMVDIAIPSRESAQLQP
jgi:zinc protease